MLTNFEQPLQHTQTARSDDLHVSSLHGSAIQLAAEQGSMAEAIEQLRQIAAGREDLLGQSAGVAAALWARDPAGQTGVQLLAAALLISARGYLDYGTALTVESAQRSIPEGPAAPCGGASI